MSTERTRIGTKVSIISLAANTVLALLKLAAGVIGGSSAMVADSLHSFSDSVSTVAVLIGLRIAEAPPDREHHYGHGRAETVAAKFVAIFLMLTAFGVGVSSVETLIEGEFRMPGQIALIAALVSIVAKEGLFQYASRVGKAIKSNALIADAWHHRTDALSSITALLGIAGARMGVPYLDPIAGLIVALMVLRTGVILYWKSIEELVDTAPDQQVVNEIVRIAKETPGVITVNEIKARTHGPKVYVDLKICVNRFITVQDGHSIAHLTSDRIKQLEDVQDILVHVNPCYKVTDREQQSAGCEECDRRQET